VSNVSQVAHGRPRVMRPMPLTLVIVGAVAFIVVYAVMTGTPGGRSLDAEWMDRAFPGSSSGFGRSSAVMRIMAPSHVVLVCVVLLLVALVWRQWRRATAMAVCILGLLGSAQVLKSLLPRRVSDALALPNSFPSGHVAGAAAIGIAMLDCVPASGVTPLRVMLCVVHYAVRAWVVSITPVWSGRGVRAVGSDGVSMAIEVSER
jgi:membrane-associated phospholipid phosphatase